jgi:DNA-binding transcriptional LysR family regulator
MSTTPSDWALMPYFLAVARMGNLRAGAAVLNANHVTTRRNIEALEAMFGARLFTRSRRGFELTEAGKALLPLAEEAEKALTAARRRVDRLDHSEIGTVRFSLPPTLAFDVVSPILAKFSRAYPGIDIDLQITDVVEDIASAQTDVSLRVAYEVSDDVVARKLYPFSIGTFASREYIERDVRSAGPSGAGLFWIGWTGPGSDESWLARSPFPNAEVRYRSSEGYMHLSLLRRGCGMSRLPVIFQSLFPELEQVPGTEFEPSRTLWILLHSDLRRTLRVRRFVDFLASELTALKPEMQLGRKR